MTIKLLTPATLTALTAHNADSTNLRIDGKAAANFGVLQRIYRPWSFDADLLIAEVVLNGPQILPTNLLNRRVKQLTGQQRGRTFFTTNVDSITQGCAAILGASHDAFRIRLTKAYFAYQDLHQTPRIPVDAARDVTYDQQLWLVCQWVAANSATVNHQLVTLLLGGQVDVA